MYSCLCRSRDNPFKKVQRRSRRDHPEDLHEKGYYELAKILLIQGCIFIVFLQKYKEFERAVRVEEIDGLRLVKQLAEDMEEMFHKKAQAMKVPPRRG